MRDNSLPTSLSADSLKRNYHHDSPETRIQLPPISSTAPLLPAGSCQFILLHPSISDQLCACQGYRRNRNVPGSPCECGHQACYHNPDASRDLPDTTASFTPSNRALMERIDLLESQLQHHQKFWQEQLDKERQLRQEETRVLREAMCSFFRFMEKDVPTRFTHLEDKIEGIMDAQERVKRKFGDVNTSAMSFDDRTIKLKTTCNVPQQKTKDKAAVGSHDGCCHRDRLSSTEPESSVQTPSTGVDVRFQQQIPKATVSDDDVPEDALIMLSQAFSLPSPPGQESDLQSPATAAADQDVVPPPTVVEHAILPSPRSMSSGDSAHSEKLASEHHVAHTGHHDSPRKRKRLTISDLSAPTEQSLTDRRTFRLPIPPPLSLSD